MSQPVDDDLETDPRFPSGPWVGYFLQKAMPGKHLMELHLRFRNGEMTGQGRDWVGAFLIRGRYETAEGRCRFHKRYVGLHDVYYTGFGENKGIWGTWEIPTVADPTINKGGFHIWPVGLPNPTTPAMSTAVEEPVGAGA